MKGTLGHWFGENDSIALENVPLLNAYAYSVVIHSGRKSKRTRSKHLMVAEVQRWHQAKFQPANISVLARIVVSALCWMCRVIVSKSWTLWPIEHRNCMHAPWYFRKTRARLPCFAQIRTRLCHTFKIHTQLRRSIDHVRYFRYRDIIESWELIGTESDKNVCGTLPPLYIRANEHGRTLLPRKKIKWLIKCT